MGLGITGRAAWRDPVQTRALYLLGPESFETETLHVLDAKGRSVRKVKHITYDRVGSCWASGRLKPGDIIVVDELSGDCFYDCYLVDHTEYVGEGVRMKLIPYKFGAYAMNAAKRLNISDRNYHLLMAGEEIMVPIQLPHSAQVA